MMHSFTLLTLASSAFAIPVLNSVANVPANVYTPVEAYGDAVVKAAAPINVAASNVDVNKVKAGNNFLSGNALNVRGLPLSDINAPVDAKTPVDAVVGAAAKVATPVEAATGNVNVKDVNALNNVASGNSIHIKREAEDLANVPVNVDAPVDAAGKLVAAAKAPVYAAAGNVDVKDVNALTDVASGNSVHTKREVEDLANVPVNVDAPVDAAGKVVAAVKAPVYAAAGNVNVKDVDALNDVASGNNVNARGNSVANVPANVKAPIAAVGDAAAKVDVPVKAAAANANVKDVEAFNGVDSGNKVEVPRDTDGIDVPTLPVVLGGAQANITKIVGNIQSLIASTPAAPVSDLLGELNTVLTGAVNQLGLLNGLGLGSILQTQDGEAELSTQQVAEAVRDLVKSVTDVLQQVTGQLGAEVPELQPVISLLNGTLQSLVSTVTSLVPGVSALLVNLLTPLSNVLNTLGLGLSLGIVGI